MFIYVYIYIYIVTLISTVCFKMASVCTFCSTGKQVTISLRKLPHEVCEAATQAAYWQQVD